MKFIKTILLIFLNILSIPLGVVGTLGIIWYILPLIKTTEIGIKILSTIPQEAIFWITLGSIVLYLVIIVLQKIFNQASSCKTKNAFIHLNTWLIALTAITVSIITFILINPLVANEVVISTTRKIGIGIGILLLILFHMFSSKIFKVINRRIQAYETAKEINNIGRGSVIFINILKLFELFFLEFVMLTILCFCISWNVASYFIIILVASLFPVIGNIECDFNVRREIRKNNENEKNILAEKIANNLKRK